jgi:hypothetical protein
MKVDGLTPILDVTEVEASLWFAALGWERGFGNPGIPPPTSRRSQLPRRLRNRLGGAVDDLPVHHGDHHRQLRQLVRVTTDRVVGEDR